MSLEKDHLDQLIKALPGEFKFYNLGEVKMEQSDSNIHFDPECISIAYRIYGDFSALIILRFEKDLDQSLYSEMGNIIVSQLATRLNTDQGAVLMISAPKILSESQFKKLGVEDNTNFRRTYSHFFRDSVIPIETLILSAPLEGSGYA